MKKAFAILVLLLLTFCAQGAKPSSSLRSRRDATDSLLYRNSRDIDALKASLGEFRAAGDSLSAALSLYYIGKYYNQNSEYILSIDYYKQALALQKKLGEDYDAIRTIIGLATSCRRIGGYSAASEYLFDGLNILDNSDFQDTEEGKRQRSYLYNGLGNVYKYLDDGEESEKYFRLSLALDEELGNHVGLAMNWSTIGNIYEYRNMPDSALAMYNRALEHNLLAKNKSGVGICYNRLGQLASFNGQRDSAEAYHLKAYEVLKNASDRWNLTKSTLSLAWLYLGDNRLKDAKEMLDEASELVEGRHSFGYEEEIHFYLSEYYKKQGAWEKAYEEAIKSLALKDSSASQKDEQAIAQNRIKFEQEKLNAELDQIILEKEKETFYRKTVTTFAIIIGSVLALFALLFLHMFNIQRKRSNALMEVDLLKNKFFSIVSHDLKNPVIAQKNALEMIVNNFDTIPKDVLYQQCKELYKSSTGLHELLTSMFNWSLLETGRMEHTPVRVDLRDLTEESVMPLEEQLSLKHITLSDEIPAETYACADVNMTQTIIRNLVSNAIKFSFDGDTIRITSEELPASKETKISIIDNGIGMSAETLDHIFDLKSHRLNKGTSGETGSGLGLIVCKEMVDLANGKIFVTSKEGIGTTFSFTVAMSD